jgi:hypothetical protein
MGLEGVRAFSVDYLSPISYIFLSPLSIALFVFLVASAIANYSMDRMHGGIPIYLSKRKVCFDDHQNFFGIGDEIGNLLAYYQKNSFLVLGREMSNLLEMLLGEIKFPTSQNLSQSSSV